MARWSHSHLASIAIALALLQAVSSENWLTECFTTTGDVRAFYDASGHQVHVRLTKQSGGGRFTSKQKFLFGEFSVKMKLIPGDSAGTVSTFYLASGDDKDNHRDEIDMEFLGSTTGHADQPIILSTNVWTNGGGSREQMFALWFDPTADYHTYTIIWNPRNIIFKVDNVVIRCFKRYADLPYPNSKPMAVFGSLWDGSSWAGAPVNWTHAPFIVTYRDYYDSACVTGGKCPAGSANWMNRRPTAAEWGAIGWAQHNHMRYNYCKDNKGFPKGLPAECSRN